MDAYAKTWFQFLFPLYIWFIVITVIVVTHCSLGASRFIGKNAVQVLATLFLLSYAKLLRIIILVFSSTTLIYPDGFHRWIWLYDGNVDYLVGRHIPLFVVALIFLILVAAPYTVTLLCIQWLQRISHHKVLHWVVKLQPLFDAYTGPYRVKCRFWTGLLLLVRVGLFLFYSFNTFGDPAVNLLATVITIVCLLAFVSVVGGVYKKWWLNMIESSFLLNICILSAVTSYQLKDGSADSTLVAFISIGTSFGIFMALTLYHHLIRIALKVRLKKLLVLKLRNTVKNIENTDQEKEVENKITHSVIELREPLIGL